MKEETSGSSMRNKLIELDSGSMAAGGLSVLGSLQNLFPTTISFVVFIAYMALFINQGLLVTATKNKENKFNYNPITVVLMTELVKLIISSAIYLKK